MSGEKAFQVFLEHWLVEENRARLRQNQKRACEKILLNRKTMDMLDRVLSCISDMVYVDAENYQDYDELMNYARQLAHDILMREEIWGLCPCCHSGIIRFFLYGREHTDFVGECSSCMGYPIVIPDLFYG